MPSTDSGQHHIYVLAATLAATLATTLDAIMSNVLFQVLSICLYAVVDMKDILCSGTLTCMLALTNVKMKYVRQ